MPIEDRTNQHVEAGEVLFKIDPSLTNISSSKRAGLADAEANVAQLKASVDQASATAGKARAELQLAQENYDRQSTLFQKNVVAQAALDTATRNLDASKQTVAEATAGEDRANRAMERWSTANTRRSYVCAMNLPMLNTIWTRPLFGPLLAALSLSWRCGRACMWSRHPSAKPRVRQNDTLTDRALAAAFQQNALQRVRAGDEAEVLFEGHTRSRIQGQGTAGDRCGRGRPASKHGHAGDVGVRLLETGHWPSLTSSMTFPLTRSRSVRQARPPSTPTTFASYRCCGKILLRMRSWQTMSSRAYRRALNIHARPILFVRAFCLWPTASYRCCAAIWWRSAQSGNPMSCGRRTR